MGLMIQQGGETWCLVDTQSIYRGHGVAGCDVRTHVWCEGKVVDYSANTHAEIKIFSNW